MPVQQRTSAANEGDLGAGPYLAKVVSNLDPSFMGGLQVTILTEEGTTVGEATQTYSVKYASPFMGSTAFENQGHNITDIHDTQKSYGFWMVPPDVGVTVIVVFIGGDASKGYWIGCVPSRFANNMTPGIASSDAVAFAEGASDKYDVSTLPVGEINRRANDLGESMMIDKIPRAVHPFADALLKQGLLADDVRGTTTSSGRRNAPSNVYGISTPGPVDRQDGAKRQFVGVSDNPSIAPVPVGRLGGTTFVMDDGDDRYQRKTPASDGPPEYADVLGGETGEATIPKDEMVRIRTRTGHQILLHNSEDLIYIGNARGTAWVELTSDGKIDIYAADSISIHSEADLNIRADRDINLEAGRNVNINAEGLFHAEAGGNVELLAGADGLITVSGSAHVSSGASNNFTSSGATNILAGGDLVETGASIQLNGPGAASASKASALARFDNPVVDGNGTWKDERYASGSLSSIMKRVPMHEPWPGHENLDPASVKSDATDIG